MVAVLLYHVFREAVLTKISLIVSGLDQFDSFSVCSDISPVDADDPSFRGERLCEIVQLEVFIPWISVSDVIISLWLAICGIHLPSAVVAEFVHQTILHGRQYHIIDAIAITRDVVFFLDVWVHATSDSHHP
jgi:hypothetical protein